eukprot:CAMPEP_0197657214 /NCGR_PEP_ID=MMETSP1338-20131121/44493_1 /TAXON_ID=43686 ORGANISM="Pelagodinium beii, Strain RCC1491" /NCGR_SAMPLE_ID=MMETSP1338 /ASSEMBLY_ACC=CAM_ASM_000754 /LENGTH=270 /DNA_ID=CAMNT_0043233535 /DNA_START=66 /DNA_END=874 /DNA_ORIENTATION=-
MTKAAGGRKILLVLVSAAIFALAACTSLASAFMFPVPSQRNHRHRRHSWCASHSKARACSRILRKAEAAAGVKPEDPLTDAGVKEEVGVLDDGLDDEEGEEDYDGEEMMEFEGPPPEVLDGWEKDELAMAILSNFASEDLQGKNMMSFRDVAQLLEVLGLEREEFVSMFEGGGEPNADMMDEEEEEDYADFEEEMQSSRGGRGRGAPGRDLRGQRFEEEYDDFDDYGRGGGRGGAGGRGGGGGGRGDDRYGGGGGGYRGGDDRYGGGGGG